MKKLFTMVAMAFMAVCVNAQSTDKTWNFSEWDNQTFTDKFTKDGLTVYASSAKNVVIDGNKKTVNEVQYKKRLKLGGGVETDARYLEFEVDGACTIEVVLISSSSDEDRTLNICANEFSKDNPLAGLSAPGSSATLQTYNYTGDACKIILGSTKGGINLYAIYVKYGNSETAIESVKANVENNGKTYNVGGRVATKGLVIKNGKKYVK